MTVRDRKYFCSSLLSDKTPAKSVQNSFQKGKVRALSLSKNLPAETFGHYIIRPDALKRL